MQAGYRVYCQAHCYVVAVRQAHGKALAPRLRPLAVCAPRTLPSRGFRGTWPLAALRVLPRTAALSLMRAHSMSRLVAKLARVHLPRFVDAQLIEPGKIIRLRFFGMLTRFVGARVSGAGHGTWPELVDVDGGSIQENAACRLHPAQGEHDGLQRAALMHQPNARLQKRTRHAQQQRAPGPRVLLRTVAPGRQRARAAPRRLPPPVE